MFKHSVEVGFLLPPPPSIKGLECRGESVCPLIHLCLTDPSSTREDNEQLLQKIADECLDNGVAVVMAKYLKEELRLPPPRSVSPQISLSLSYHVAGLRAYQGSCLCPITTQPFSHKLCSTIFTFPPPSNITTSPSLLLPLSPPSIRLTVCSEHSEEELSRAAAVIKEAAANHIT